MSNYPLISIITVVYNGVSTLERTILSVINQTYKNIEYIIIDGGSTDGTVDIIKKYEKHLTYWISETDGGVYDAMNKGIIKATGEWTNFMNSGDWFFDNNVIESLFSLFPKEDLVYGSAVMRFERGNCLQKPKNKLHPWNIKINHQSLFCKSYILNTMRFNTKYKIASDYEFLHKCFNNNYTMKYYDIIVSSCETPGISNSLYLLSIKERLQILFCNKWYRVFNMLLIIKTLFYGLKSLLSIWVSYFFPSIMQKYRSWKYQNI